MDAFQPCGLLPLSPAGGPRGEFHTLAKATILQKNFPTAASVRVPPPGLPIEMHDCQRGS